MVKICKENGCQLIRYYDFHEPCEWTDQCEEENADTKSILHSYVDSGNSIFQVEKNPSCFRNLKTRWN